MDVVPQNMEGGADPEPRIPGINNSSCVSTQLRFFSFTKSKPFFGVSASVRHVSNASYRSATSTRDTSSVQPKNNIAMEKAANDSAKDTVRY